MSRRANIAMRRNALDAIEGVATMMNLIIEGIKKSSADGKWQEYVNNFDPLTQMRLLKQQSKHIKQAYNHLYQSDDFQLNDQVVSSLQELGFGLSTLWEFLRPFVPLMPSENATEDYSFDEGRRIYSSVNSLTPLGKGITVYSKDIPEEEFIIIDKPSNGFFFFRINPTWKVSGENQTLSVSRNGLDVTIRIGRVEKPVRDQSQQASPSTKMMTLYEDMNLVNEQLSLYFIKRLGHYNIR